MLVGSHDLSSGEILQDGDLRWQRLPEGQSADGYFVEGRDDPATLFGALLTAVAAEGDPVAKTAVVKPPLRALAGGRHLSKGAILGADDLRWRTLPKDLSADDYFVQGRDTRAKLKGALLTVAVAAGTPVPAAAVVMPPLRVLVGNHDLSSGEILHDGDLRWQRLPVSAEVRAEWRLRILDRV